RFLLDSTDISSWSSSVAEPAAEVTAAFLAGGEMPVPGTLSEAAREVLQGEEEVEVPCRRECDLCGVTAVFESKWVEHLKSYRHKRQVAKRKKMALVPAPGEDRARPSREGDAGGQDSRQSRSSTPDLSFMNPP
ncbi:MAG: zinc finger RNA-binding protein, partial [Acidobacteria bacterium]|nr:zinc finger RNA-binding protein [Acidobacteriota bacterium]